MKRMFHTFVSCTTAVALMASALAIPGNFLTNDTAKAATAPDNATITAPARVSVHDPSIAVSKEGMYYVFGSHIDAAKSKDMVNWETFTNNYTTPNNKLFGDLEKNLKVPFAWAGCRDRDATKYSVWAPDVFWNKDYVNEDGTKGAYLMYFCTTSTATRSVIAFAASQDIEGPYTFVDTLVYSGFTKISRTDSGSKIDTQYTHTNIKKLIDDGTLKDGLNDDWFNTGGGFDNGYAPNAIDPTVFEDKDGKLWMTYGSWSGGIFLLEINPATGRAIYPGKSSKTDDTRIVDSYFGTRIAGGNRASGEGPYILYDKESDYYYLYVSYEGLEPTKGYNMRLFRSKSPDGPYLDAAGHNAALDNTSKISHNEIGIRVIGNYKFPCHGRGLMAAGHNSALIDNDGERYLIYHQKFDDGTPIHQVRVHQQFINEIGWPVTAVYENKGDKISKTGYNKDELVGDYYFINHGTERQFDDLHLPKNLVLGADGKVSGAASGTWEEKDGTCYAKFVLDGVTYNGVFFKQHTETGESKNVMTFTAIGTNNKTIMGSKRAVSLSLNRKTIYVGGNQNKTAKITVNGSSTTPYTITYKSSKPSVASVNNKGVITAKKAGSSTITGTYKAGSVTRNMTVKITVKKASLKFTKSKSKIKAGKSSTFQIKGYGVKPSSAKWKSSKKKILTVGKKSGAKVKVKAVKAGKATITVSYKKIKITKKVTVQSTKKAK